MSNIIIKKPDNYGKTRSEQEKNLRKEWGRTMTDSQLDKLQFLEKKHRDQTGSRKNFLTGIDIDNGSHRRIPKSRGIKLFPRSQVYLDNYDKINWGNASES